MDLLRELVKNRHKEYEIAINTNYGGFSITKEMCEELNIDYEDNKYIFNHDRSNPILINLIKKYKPKDIKIETLELEEISGSYISSYDGKESISSGYDHDADVYQYPLLDHLCNIKYKR